MLHRFADMLGNQGGGEGPLDWNLAKNIARHTVSEQGDPSIVDAERRQVEDALRLADLWLDEATPLRSGDCLAGLAASDARERAAVGARTGRRRR